MNSELNGAAFTARANHRTNHGGFTMMELLVFIATTGILVVMVRPPPRSGF
jgi:Tfp pilus assembly protein FimT